MRHKTLLQDFNAIKVFTLAIVIFSYGCSSAKVPVAVSGKGVCAFNPSTAIATKSFDLREATSEKLATQLRSVELNDLLIVNSKITSNEQAMSKIAATKNVKFALVADESPAAAQIFLEAPTGKPQILAVLPTESEAIKGVYGVTSPDAVKYMTKNYEQYVQLNGVKLISNKSESFRSRVIKEIQSSENNDLFILVGHNDNGVIRGPNGEGISFKEINEECLLANRPAIILSCNTIRQSTELKNTVVTPRNLEYDEIASAIKRTQTELASLESPNISDYVMKLSESFDTPRQQSNRRVVILSVVGSLAILITIYEVNCEDDSLLCIE